TALMTAPMGCSSNARSGTSSRELRYDPQAPLPAATPRPDRARGAGAHRRAGTKRPPRRREILPPRYRRGGGGIDGNGHLPLRERERDPLRGGHRGGGGVLLRAGGSGPRRIRPVAGADGAA